MKKIRFYKIIIAFLILLNGSTLYFFWTSSRHQGPPGKNELVELLNLEGSKKTKILQMQDVHFAKKHALINKSRNLHEQLFRNFNDPAKDSSANAKLIDEIVENQRETEQMTFDYFKSVNALCAPEQQEKLQELIHDVLRRAGGPPRPRK